MKIRTLLLLLCFSGSVPALFAGNEYRSFANTVAFTNSESTGEGVTPIPFEFETQYSFSSDSEVARGFRQVRSLDEDYFFTRFVYTPRVKLGILRLGAAYERFGFSAPRAFELPRGLQSAAAVVGLDTELSEALLVRFEAQPGLYGGSRLHGGDFRVPFLIGGTYIYSSDLQFVLGVSVDYDRSFPVFPGGGIRWRTGSQWVVNAVLPTPRVEFEAVKGFTLYAGADVKGSTFRVGDRFGFERGNPALNNAVLTYSEVRTGAGFEWKLVPQIKFSMEAGYVPYRNFDFHRTEVRYHQESGGAYVSASIAAAF